MRKTIAGLFACLLVALVLLGSCASTFDQAGNALAQGDYITAISKSLESIAKGKDVSGAETVLKNAWQRANNEWNAQIATFEKATTSNELSKAIPVYDKLLTIHHAVARAGRSDLNPTYDTLLENSSQTSRRISELLFKEGSAFLALGGRENARKAVLTFRKIKAMNPIYYAGIEYDIEQATKQATVKVFVFSGGDTNYDFNSINMIKMVEEQLSAMEFVQVVGPPLRYSAPIGDDHRAKDFARGHSADLMIHFEPSTTYESGVKRVSRPLASSVTEAADWKVEKLSIQTSATCDVRYIVVDLTTDKNIAQGTFTVEESTDHGFSVTAIPHTGKKENLEIGNMSSSQPLLINTLKPGASVRNLINSLTMFEASEIQRIGSGIRPALLNIHVPLDFSKYQLPSQLAKIEDLNGHTFFLFDVIEEEYPGEEGEKGYASFYNDFLGIGFQGQIETSRYDRGVYQDLVNWMESKETKDSVKNAFMENFYLHLIPKKIAENVASVLK